jgi:hypothetical protein
MARKQKRSRTAASRKPIVPDDDFEAVIQQLLTEYEHQQRPAFKARLAAAERNPKWQRFKEQFKRIADEREQAKQPKSDKPTIPQEWKDAVAKYAPPPPQPLKPMSGKAWLESVGFKKFPRKPGESKRAWSRRLSKEAAKDNEPLKPDTIRPFLPDA